MAGSNASILILYLTLHCQSDQNQESLFRGEFVKKDNLAILALAFCAAQGAHAQTVPVAAGVSSSFIVGSPSMQAAASLAEGDKNGDDTFDGMPILRREPPLVILKEEKNIFLGRGRDNDTWSGSYTDDNGISHDCGPGDGNRGTCWRHKSDAYQIYGDRQKVGIEDRKTYVANEAKKGRFGGQYLGGFFVGSAGIALAFLTLPVLPAILVGAAAMAAAIVIGGKISTAVARRRAENQPRVFEREVNIRKEY